MAGQGSPQLFVYYQPPQRVTDSGEVQTLNAHDEFFVTDGKCPNSQSNKIKTLIAVRFKSTYKRALLNKRPVLIIKALPDLNLNY